MLHVLPVLLVTQLLGASPQGAASPTPLPDVTRLEQWSLADRCALSELLALSMQDLVRFAPTLGPSEQERPQLIILLGPVDRERPADTLLKLGERCPRGEPGVNVTFARRGQALKKGAYWHLALAPEASSEDLVFRWLTNARYWEYGQTCAPKPAPSGERDCFEVGPVGRSGRVGQVEIRVRPTTLGSRRLLTVSRFRVDFDRRSLPLPGPSEDRLQKRRWQRAGGQRGGRDVRPRRGDPQ